MFYWKYIIFRYHALTKHSRLQYWKCKCVLLILKTFGKRWKKSTECHIGCFLYRLSCIFCMIVREIWRCIPPGESYFSSQRPKEIWFCGGNKSSHLQNVHAINYYNEQQVMIKNALISNRFSTLVKQKRSKYLTVSFFFWYKKGKKTADIIM